MALPPGGPRRPCVQEEQGAREREGEEKDEGEYEEGEKGEERG